MTNTSARLYIGKSIPNIPNNQRGMYKQLQALLVKPAIAIASQATHRRNIGLRCGFGSGLRSPIPGLHALLRTGAIHPIRYRLDPA